MSPAQLLLHHAHVIYFQEKKGNYAHYPEQQ